MTPLTPLTHDVVLLGGGHTHALVLRRWGMDRLKNVRLTLVNPDVTAPYTGMLPGYVAGHYLRSALDIDLVRLARFAGARLVCDAATGIDRENQLVHLMHRPPIRYDVLSVDIGVTAAISGVAGFQEYAHSVKPLGLFATAWDRFVDDQQNTTSEANVVVIGGGVAGVEIALAMAHRLRACDVQDHTITLIEADTELLKPLGQSARKWLRQQLIEYGVTTLTGAHPVSVSNDHVTLSDGSDVQADFVISAAGAAPHGWLQTTGLDLTNGYINVDPTLRSVTDPKIFAAGDCAHLTHAPRPKAGVFAVRQAPVLHDNLRAAVGGTPLKKYTPQSDYLKLVSAGQQAAVAEKFGLSITGKWLWRLKDRIDQRFMASFRDLPSMAPASASDEEDMLCGGCGAKVAQRTLHHGLSSAGASKRRDVLRGLGDDAAILLMGEAKQVIAVDHLRSFTDDPWMLSRIATVHALGDIWAMGASPQSGLLSVTLPRMGEDMQAATLREITQAAQDVLTASGADLVGGHTSLGAELSVGLTVTGLCEGEPIGLSGAKAGDALILTKPIGTGIVLAAHMRNAAQGAIVQSALDHMQQPLSQASAILSPKANAMTDVTGFGLAGHLMSLLEASDLQARLELGAFPILDGALELVERGFRSSLWPANAELRSQMTLPPAAKADLLFDPQTAGGLLAAVPSDAAVQLVQRLRECGEHAAIVGHVVAGDPWITVTGTAD